MQVDVTLYMVARKQNAVLEKRISLPVLPRVGESIKFRNSKLGDYFTFTVEQITHREGGIPKIRATTRQIVDIKLKQYYWHKEDFDGDVASYIAEGWSRLRGPRKRRGRRAVSTRGVVLGARSKKTA